MIKHASMHYHFAAVQNIRNNFSDTSAILVMIDTTFKSMNVLHWMHTRSQVDVLTCTLLVFTSLLCSVVVAALGRRKYSRFLRLLLSASLGVSLSLLRLYCSLLHQRRPPYPFNTSNGLQHQSFNLHKPSQQSLQITRHDYNHYTYQIWQCSNLCC